MAYFFAMFKYGAFKKILDSPNDELAYVDNPVESGLSGHWLPLSILKRIMEMRVESRPQYTPNKKLNFIITEKYIKPSAYTTITNKMTTYKIISSGKTAAITTNNNEEARTFESNKKLSGDELRDTTETTINTIISETITNAKLTSVIVETTPSKQEEVEGSTIMKTTEKLSSELTEVTTTEISTTLDGTVAETTVGLTKETLEEVTNKSTTEVSKQPTTESTTVLTTPKITATTVVETGNPFY